MIGNRAHILLTPALPLPVHIRGFCRCAVAAGGCMRRPRRRVRRRRPCGRDGTASATTGPATTATAHDHQTDGPALGGQHERPRCRFVCAPPRWVCRVAARWPCDEPAEAGAVNEFDEAHRIVGDGPVVIPFPEGNAAVREFLTIIAAQARAALELAGIEQPGLLQISQLDPTEKRPPALTRYRFNEVEPDDERRIGDPEVGRMVRDAIAASQAGVNVHIEGRTVRADTPPKKRGDLGFTAAVFALVMNPDADKAMGWSPTVPIGLTVETVRGTITIGCSCARPSAPRLPTNSASASASRSAADHDSGTPTQPYRVAGTTNYPNAKKRERGRVTVPTPIAGVQR